jgi:hypothetical protein
MFLVTLFKGKFNNVKKFSELISAVHLSKAALAAVEELQSSSASGNLINRSSFAIYNEHLTLTNLK